MQLINQSFLAGYDSVVWHIPSFGFIPDTNHHRHTDRHIRKLTETKKQPYPTLHHHHQISFKIPVWGGHNKAQGQIFSEEIFIIGR